MRPAPSDQDPLTISSKEHTPTLHDQVEKAWNVPASAVSQRIVNPIRRIVDGNKIAPNPEKSVIPLSLGDPTAFGYLKTHAEVLAAVSEQLPFTVSQGYAPSVGFMDARKAVADFYNSLNAFPSYTPEDVMLTSGCSQAVEIALEVLVNPGQEVLLPSPGFPLYETQALARDMIPKYYDLKANDGWQVELVQFEALITERTAAVVLTNPSNPCGSVFSAAHLRAIVEICAKKRVPIIADEIYNLLSFTSFTPAASLGLDVPILTLGGLAKNWLVPGWRVGWMLVHDPVNALGQVRGGIMNLSQMILGPNTLIQKALPRILSKTPASFYANNSKLLKENAELMMELLAKVKGIRIIPPQGSMYLMMEIDFSTLKEMKNDVEFTERLLAEESVGLLPGSCFRLPGFVRVVYAASVEKIKEACERIESFMQRHTH